MNIYDVSKRAGVSIATVSRVMNDNPNVRPNTREKVLKAMEDLSYTPNVFARGLGLNSMHSIGIICTDSSDTFLSNAIYYLEQGLRKSGYDSILSCTGYELINKQNYLKLILSKRVDAIVLVGSSSIETSSRDNAYILEAAEEVPVMIINGYIKHPNIYCTLCDDYQAMYDATSSLLNQGYQAPIYLYNSKSYSGRLKMNGYQDAMEAQEQSEHTTLLCCPKEISTIKEILSKQYKQTPFDAVICSEDLLAVGAVKFAKQRHIRIPDEIAIIGCNNSILATCCEPELTSIDNHIEALCNSTISTLMGVLSHGGEGYSNKLMLSNHLMKRKTTR